MPFTRIQALDALARWQPASVFLDSYRTKRLPEGLDIYFGPPEEFFLSPDTQFLYTQDRIVRILDNGNFDLVLFDDPKMNQLVSCLLKNRMTSPGSSIGSSTSGSATRVGESCDDDDSVRRMADLIEIPLR